MKNLLSSVKNGLVALAAIAIALPSGCSREDDLIFDKPATVRLTEAMQRYNDWLVAAPNGWIMEYAPADHETLGAFTLSCTFRPNGWATFVSDVDSYDLLPEALLYSNQGEVVKYHTGQISSSLFTWAGDQGPVLSFSTHSVLNIFSDPLSGTVMPDGFMGDFEFIVRSADESTFELEGRRYHGRATLRRLGSPAQLDSILTTARRIRATPRVRLNANGADYRIVMENCRLLRVFDPRRNGDLNELLTVRFAASTKGIHLLEPITLNGATVQDFVFDEHNNLVAEGNSMYMRDAKPLEALLDTTQWRFNIFYRPDTMLFSDTVHVVDSVKIDTIKAPNGDILYIHIDTLYYHDSILYTSFVRWPLIYDTTSMDPATFHLLDSALHMGIDNYGELLAGVYFGQNLEYRYNRFGDLNRYGVVFATGNYNVVFGLHFEELDDGSLSLTPTSAGKYYDESNALLGGNLQMLLDHLQTSSPYTLEVRSTFKNGAPSKIRYVSRDNPGIWFDLLSGVVQRGQY